MIWIFLLVLGAVLMAAGVMFMVVASIGFVRLPNVFCRLHVTGILDTLGAPLVLLGAAVTLGASLAAAKLVLGLAFLFVTSPLVGHLLSRAALEAREDARVEGQAQDARPHSGKPGQKYSEAAA